MSADKTIHVALASDDNYFEGLLVTAWSIARNCSRPSNLVLHILDGGISEEHFAFLAQRISTFGSTIDRIKVNQTESFGSFSTYRGNSRMTYARLLLPDLLPDVGNIIYTDVDIAWAVDIAELWDSLSDTAVLHYIIKGGPIIPEEIKWFEDNGFKIEPDTRFCAGMIVMNLEKFRQENLHIKMLDAITQSGGKTPCVDETALNAFMFWRTDKIAIPRRWQRMSGGIQNTVERDGCVIHFGADAPWRNLARTHQMVTDLHIVWHGLHAEARGISTWKSFRMFSPASAIVLFRALYVLGANLLLVRKMLHGLMILKGLRQNIPCLDCYLCKFPVKEINPRLLPR